MRKLVLVTAVTVLLLSAACDNKTVSTTQSTSNNTQSVPTNTTIPFSPLTPRDIVVKLNAAAQQSNNAEYEKYVTKGSIAMKQEAIAAGLPTKFNAVKIEYISEYQEGSKIIVKVKQTDNATGSTLNSEMVFVQENGEWKYDERATLEREFPS